MEPRRKTKRRRKGGLINWCHKLIRKNELIYGITWLILIAMIIFVLIFLLSFTPLVESAGDVKAEDNPIITSGLKSESPKKPGLYFTKEFEADVTYYCDCEICCGKSDGITASGTLVQENRTIAAGNDIPFGTQILIGNIIYTVEDRGSAISGNEVDIYVKSHEEAIKLGRETKTAYIIGEIKNTEEQN